MPEPLVKPELNHEEEHEAQKRVAVSARVVHEAIRKQGEEELERTSSALAFSGLAAGLSMGFSFAAEAILHQALPDAPWRTLIAKLGYPLGYLIVIIGRQQLFTENTLTAIIPLFARRDRKTLTSVMRLWFVVLLANLAGAHIFAWVAANTPAFTPEIQHSLNVVAHQAAAIGFGAAFIRGILAGWLIALVVWLLAASDSAQIAIIGILTYAVGIAGLTHIIAGSIEVLFLVMSGQMAWLAYVTSFVVPVLLGNIIGGVALVSVLNHGQVVAGQDLKANAGE